MEKAELLEYFDFLVSNEDVKNAKPDPEIYTTAINKLNLLPEECLVLEDNKNGILAAKRSGANLLKVQDVHDVNYMNIMNRIKEVENG